MKKMYKKALLSALVATALVSASTATLLLKDTTADAANVETTGFEMVEGAAIRLRDPYGLRFIAEMGEMEYETLTTPKANTIKKMGMFIMPYSYLSGVEEGKWETIETKINHVFYASDDSVDNKLYEHEYDNGDTYYRANGVIADLYLHNYDTEFIGIAYVSETNTISDKTTYTYADFSYEENVRTAAYVAIEAYSDYEHSTTAKNVFNDYIDGAHLDTLGVTQNANGTYTYGGKAYNTIQDAKAGLNNVEYQLTLDEKDIIYVNSEKTLNATLKDVNHDITFEGNHIAWKSSNENVVMVDDNGVLTSVGKGVATVIGQFRDKKVSLNVISKALSFEDLTTESLATDLAYFKKADTTESLSVVEGGLDGDKVLQIKNTASGAAPALIVTRDFLKSFFDDANVAYVAFDAKAGLGNYNNFRRVTKRSNGTFAADCYVADIVNNNVPVTGIRNDAFKTFYFSRADYQSWIDNNVTEQRIIASGGVQGGDSFYVDNIRPVTQEQYNTAIYTFEGDGVRVNDAGRTLLMYTPKSGSDWSFNLQVESGKVFTDVGYTNENVTEGIRALTFTKTGGTVTFNFHNEKQAYADIVTKTGYWAIDVYVSEDSDAKINYQYSSYPGAPMIKGGWTTIYIAPTRNSLTITDTTGGTYAVDNIRWLSETEYSLAALSFEVGGIRNSENYAGDAGETGGVARYYGGIDHSKGLFSFTVAGSTSGQVTNSRFDSTIVHDGMYSFAFEKTGNYIYATMRNDSTAYSLLKNGFSFWIYSTTAINGTTANNFINGANGKFNGGAGITIPANTWTQVIVTAADMNPTRFLIMQGSWTGTVYLDDFQPLSADSISKITYNAGEGTASMSTQILAQGMEYTLATATAPKMYQEFLGWYDENGNKVAMSGVWNMTGNVTLKAKYSDYLTFDSGVVPSYITHDDRYQEAFTVVEINGNKVLKSTTLDDCISLDASIRITRAALNDIFADSSVQYMAFDVMADNSCNTQALLKYYYYISATDQWKSYEKEDPFIKKGYHSIPTDSFRTYYFPRSAYENWITNSKDSERFLLSAGLATKGASFYIDNIRPATQEDYESAILGFELGANALRDDVASSNVFYYYGGADYTANRYSFAATGSPLEAVWFDHEVVHGGNSSLAFTKAKDGINIQMRADSTTYALLKHGFTFWIYSTVGINGVGDSSWSGNFLNGNGQRFNGGVGLNIKANTWTQITVTEADIKHATGDAACPFLRIQGSTAGTIYIDDIVALPYEEPEEPELPPVSEENVYNATGVMEGDVVKGLVLNASTHTLGLDVLPKDASDTEDMSYYKFDGTYGLNDFLVFDFTGDNVPLMSFFTTEVGKSVYNQDENEEVKGWIVTNGMTTKRGLPYSGSTSNLTNRLNIIGPYKISNLYDNTTGNTLDQVRASEGNAANPSPITMPTLKESYSDTPFRMIVGWVANGNYMNLVMKVYDLSTGQEYLNYNLNKNIAKAGWEGDIALYGHFGRQTVVDAIYPVEENTTIEAVVEKYKPTTVVYNGRWDGNSLMLNASTHVGATSNVPLNSGYKEDMSYIAFEGEYGLNDYVVFDFTGDNFPFVSFFNTEVTNTIFNFANDTSIGGWIIANGIKAPNKSSFGGDTGAHANRILFVGSNKISYRYDDNGSTAQWRASIGSASTPSPIAITPLKAVTDTYRAIIGYVDNGGNGAKARIYVVNMVTGAVVVNYTQALEHSYSEGSIILYGQFGTGTKLDQVFGVEEDTTMDALIAKYGKDTDYSDEAAVTLDRYAYSSLSNGQWTLNGDNQVSNPTDFRKQDSSYTTYKDAGFNIVLAQDMISTDGTAADWSASEAKTFMDKAYAAGLKVILTDWHLQVISKPISVSTGSKPKAADSTYVPWVIGTDASATTGAVADYMNFVKAGISPAKDGATINTLDTTRFKTRDDLDKWVYDQLAPYMNHPAFYGVMLADEPSYHNAYCYGEVYKSIKRVAPDCYVQYNLLPMEHNFGTVQYRMPGLSGYTENTITNQLIEAAYKSYVESYVDCMGIDYIQYDDYPMKTYTAGGYNDDWEYHKKGDAYIDPTALRCLQIVAEVAKARNLDVKVVTQSCVMKSNGNISIRALTEDDARWLNNYLMGFGVKQINYFTYWTKASNSSSGEYFVDGGSFVNRDGTTTALYNFMKTIMADNTKFASTISHFDYNGSKVVTGSSYKYSDDHIVWGTMTANSFKWLTNVTTSTDATLVTELYDKNNYNYMYMVMNTIDPNEKNANKKDTTQSITITLDSAITKGFYVYDQSGNRTEYTGNTYTVSLTAGQAIYIMPKF